ncbi:hypothetical protein Hanom_Chr07g00609131 [Helianthus anomalus]
MRNEMSGYISEVKRVDGEDDRRILMYGVWKMASGKSEQRLFQTNPNLDSCFFCFFFFFFFFFYNFYMTRIFRNGLA